MARFIIAYVCPGPDWHHRSWALGAIANDEAGVVVAANPNLDRTQAAEAAGLPEQVLGSWEETMRAVVQSMHTIYDPQKQRHVLVEPTDPRFLEVIAADGSKQWNFYYSEVAEQPGSAAAVAEQVAGGPAQVS